MPQPRTTCEPRRSARLTTVGLILAALVVPTTPVAARSKSAVSRPPAPEPVMVQQRSVALQRVAGYRRLAGAGRLGDVVRAALPGSFAPSPHTAGVSRPADLPGAIDAILRMVSRAQRETWAAVEGSDIDPTQIASLTTAPSLPHGEPSLLPAVAPAAPAARAGIDRILGAGLELVDALDRAMPALSGAPTGPLPSGGRIQGCDIVEQLPLLCVGGSGDNLYTEDAALLIDLGGSDLHRHSAGGTGIIDTNTIGPDTTFVSVTVDVAGDDMYETPTSRHVFAQGAAQIGVGILVDLEGDDRYATTLLDRGPTKAGYISALGAGGYGLGLHADLQGDDVREIRNRCVCASFDGSFGFGDLDGNAYGYGRGAIGAGILLDPDGDDSYVLESTMVPFPFAGQVHTHAPKVEGFGYGTFGGTGFFLDGKGADELLMLAETPSDPEGLDAGPQTLGATARGFGIALIGGVGVAVTGDGPTEMRFLGSWTQPQDSATSQFLGMGLGQLGGFAALSDLGGNDLYEIRMVARSHRRVTVDDTCSCYGAVADTTIPLRASPNSLVYGMGLGAAGGVGILHDSDGNDRYLAHASHDALAEAKDRRRTLRDDGTDAGASARAHAGIAWTEVHGVGVLGGTGILIDQAGNDVYESVARTEARALAEAAHADAMRQAFTRALEAQSYSQALGGYQAGVGQLYDAGGVDRYVSDTSTAATSSPDTVSDERQAISIVQGVALWDGASLFADLGDGSAADVFASLPPSQPVCAGERGGLYWRGCPDPANAALGSAGASGTNAG